MGKHNSTMIIILSFLLISIIQSQELDGGNDCAFDIVQCDCENNFGSLSIDCSGKGLTEMPNFGASKFLLNNLDLSNNKLTEFPSNLKDFPLLKSLDLSNNQIRSIPEMALEECTSLQYLYVNSNNISSWTDINPNTVLKQAISLESFIMSDNPLASFTTVDHSFILVSSSLKLLDLSRCQFTRITDHVLAGLPKLEHLLLNDNPVRVLGDISSETLRTLSLSNCKLSYLRSTIFSKLPSLTYVSLSRNHRVSLERQANDTIRSQSLKQIDLSYCNMDEIELQSFPNLVSAILKGNLINHLNRFSFEGNPDLQNLDLSYNAITNMTSGTFRNLKFLKHLDLSFNMIRKIERDTFKHNEHLTDINLSRNYIDRFNRFVARSLTYLNMSWCEIMNIDLDAFADMPELIQLDLSNNLFTDFPISLRSDTIQTLDLGRCRLTKLRNETFQGFPELSSINLGGNRFTAPFHKDYFMENPYLRDVWLGDNPWRCECSTPGFYDFYAFITTHPAKINDRGLLRCFSPDEVYGSSWEIACFNTWYTNHAQMGLTQKIWMFMMIGIIILAASACIFMSIKKCIEGRKAAMAEEERNRHVEEAREIARMNRMRLEQQAQLNAPDPRESRPPCYADAILLPRVDGTYVSLEDLSLKRKKRKQKENSENEETHISRRNRSRSENVLSTDERNLTNVLPLINNELNDTSANRRTRRNEEIQQTNPSTIIEPELHYLAIDLLSLDHSTSTGRGQAASSATRNTEPMTIASASTPSDDLDENIQNFEFTNSSPYAQRRVKAMTNHLKESPAGSGEMRMIEDHYSHNISSSSGSSEEFTSFSHEEMKNL